MKKCYTGLSLVRICRCLGITRQAYYQYYWQEEEKNFEHEIILEHVRQLRKDHPVMGGRKLYLLLQPILIEHQIKMGRDMLFNLLANNYLLVKKRRRSISTTQSHHWLKKYPNLIRDIQLKRPNELWVSDITYWKINQHFLYINFITDAYSHKIVGYCLADNLEAANSLRALKMAITSTKMQLKGLIHHSDRGVQYCSSEYVKLLQDNDIKISMTENGDPLENAVAERINGIMKEEYLNHLSILNHHQAQSELEKAICKYNYERPHMSCNWMNPENIHQGETQAIRKWKNYYKKKDIVNEF